MKYRDVVARLEADGWEFDRTVGSHLRFCHPTNPGIVTIACGGKLSRDVPSGILSSILRQAGLKKE
jgi:predicted RNA binding protein YcfA (HicA-like mRNA interferase family)